MRHRPTRLRVGALSAAALIAVAGLVGCGADEPVADPPAAGSFAADPSGGNAGPAEQIAIENWVIDTFPVPEGAEVSPLDQPSSPDEATITIDFTGGDSAEIVAFYAEALAAEGYTVSVVDGVGVSFSGNGVSGDVIDSDPVSIVINRD